MRQLIAAATCVYLFLAAPTFAAQSDTKTAYKFDEFSYALPSDVKARLDHLASTLQNDTSSRIFLIAYRSHSDLPGVSGRVLKWMRQYLLYTRMFEESRVVVIDGGETSCLSYELWVVPAGATPAIRKDVYSARLDDPESTRKFDEYYYGNDYEGWGIGYSLEGFAAALRKEPKSSGYIIAYGQHWVSSWEDCSRPGKCVQRKQVYTDRPSVAHQALRSFKNSMVKTHGIDAWRIRTVYGGHRKVQQAELWIVPPGEHPPIATPNAFPAKGKSR